MWLIEKSVSTLGGSAQADSWIALRNRVVAIARRH